MNKPVTDAQIEAFRAAVEKKVQSYYDKNFPKGDPFFRPKIGSEAGPKYVRLVMESGESRSAYGFVNKETGEVLKAAGWKAPAKHARGNLNNPDGGLGCCGPHGTAYLR